MIPVAGRGKRAFLRTGSRSGKPAVPKRRRGKTAPDSDQPAGQCGQVHRSRRRNPAGRQPNRFRKHRSAAGSWLRSRTPARGSTRPGTRRSSSLLYRNKVCRPRPAPASGCPSAKPLLNLWMAGSKWRAKLGKGTLFRVWLPAGIVEAADVKTPESKPRVIGLAPGQKTWRILIADDHMENRLLLKTLLEEAGFAVLEAKTAKKRWKHSKRRPLTLSGWTCGCRSWTAMKPYGRSGGGREVLSFPLSPSRPALFRNQRRISWQPAVTTWSSNRFRSTRFLR